MDGFSHSIYLQFLEIPNFSHISMRIQHLGCLRTCHFRRVSCPLPYLLFSMSHAIKSHCKEEENVILHILFRCVIQMSGLFFRIMRQPISSNTGYKASRCQELWRFHSISYLSIIDIHEKRANVELCKILHTPAAIEGSRGLQNSRKQLMRRRNFFFFKSNFLLF